jgi:hypothetical protein
MRHSGILCASLLCGLASCAADDDGFAVTESTATGEISQDVLAVGLASFQDVKSGRCIGVDGASTANGALIKQFTCDGTSNQNWNGSSAGAQNTLKNQKSARCMGVSGASKAAGANVAQFTCDGSANQSWLLVQVGGTSTNPILNFHNVNSALCLGVDGASTANGAQLKQFSCDGSTNQQWRGIPR